MSELLHPTPDADDPPDGFSELLARAHREPRLSAEEERRLARLAARGDRGARDRLINAHVRLVVYLARQQPHGPGELPDLVQDGLVGLIRAVDRFDWRRGNRLSTYAVYWIRQSLGRSRRHLISISTYQREQESAVRSATRALELELGRAPTTAELAIATGLAEQAVERSLQRLPIAVVSHDAAAASSMPGEFGDHADPSVEAESQERRDALARAVTALPERLRTVLTLRYGLGGEPALSSAEAGARLGLTRRQTNRLETAGLERLFRNASLREAVGWLPRRLRSLFPFGLASPWAALKGAVSGGAGAKAVAATIVVAGATSIGAWQDVGPFGDGASERPADAGLPAAAAAAWDAGAPEEPFALPAHDRPLLPPATRGRPESRAAPLPGPGSGPDGQEPPPAAAGEPATAGGSTASDRPSEAASRDPSRPRPRSGQAGRSQAPPDSPAGPLEETVGDVTSSLPVQLPPSVEELASDAAGSVASTLDQLPVLPDQLPPPAELPSSEPAQTPDAALQSLTGVPGR